MAGYSKRATKAMTLEIDEVGSVQFRYSPLARHLNIRIKPFLGVHVSVPKTMSLKNAEVIVRSKTDWIVKSLRKVREFESRAIVYDGTKEVRTREHKLDVRPAQVGEATATVTANLIKVRYPQDVEVTDPRVQAVIRAGLDAAYRQEAEAYLPLRVRELARLHGFRYKRVFIKNHKSRWGSCSAVNNINLSLHLLRLPEEVIDYVILHELVHTEIKNHSEAFWARLQEVCPKVKSLKRRLRELEKRIVR
ncbi:MAG: M48 family metallopeptidase [bacterium]